MDLQNMQNILCDVCGNEYLRDEDFLQHRQKHELERVRRQYLRDHIQGHRHHLGQLATVYAANSASQAQQAPISDLSEQRLLASLLPRHQQLLAAIRQQQLRQQQLLAAIQQYRQPISQHQSIQESQATLSPPSGQLPIHQEQQVHEHNNSQHIVVRIIYTVWQL
ncbi:putative cyclin-dependent serine/threonine-protein kinase DDB_G0272797/DDB_G0274007 [Drosophila tropicalis]|uniref:putative cyclin-dependent serine/threonine-protein kinase DDB_G0272797/DDB_G0274007 n=1 Tax=Drosophila tropicalis TaxID=46794 RepID=UPI0035ABA3AF